MGDFEQLLGRWLAEGGLEGLVWTFGAIGARVGAAVWIAPFMGGRLVPAPVKAALTALLALLLVPHVAPTLGPLTAAPSWIRAAVLGKEALVGAALGFVVALAFWAAQSAGQLVDMVRGAGMSEAALPQSRSERTSPVGSLLFQLTVVLFFMVGGHHLFLTALAGSYDAVPVMYVPSASGLGGFALLCCRLTADVILLALSLAAPVVAAVALADLILGLINRFTPQVNVFFLAMPAKALLGIGVLVLSVGLLLGALPPLLGRAVAAVERALALLG